MELGFYLDFINKANPHTELGQFINQFLNFDNGEVLDVEAGWGTVSPPPSPPYSPRGKGGPDLSWLLRPSTSEQEAFVRSLTWTEAQDIYKKLISDKVYFQIFIGMKK